MLRTLNIVLRTVVGRGGMELAAEGGRPSTPPPGVGTVFGVDLHASTKPVRNDGPRYSNTKKRLRL